MDTVDTLPAKHALQHPSWNDAKIRRRLHSGGLAPCRTWFLRSIIPDGGNMTT
jgi:hypothetical protein